MKAIPWKLSDGTYIALLTEAQLDMLPDGVELRGIHGRSVRVGRDAIDQDTRQGLLAYGLPIPTPAQEGEQQ